MHEWESKTTPETKRIEELLRQRFLQAHAYRHNSASIRVRVIDPQFKGMSMSKREDLLQPLIEELPEDVQEDITVLLLLAPDESETSMMNVEFEHPTPSTL